MREMMRQTDLEKRRQAAEKMGLHISTLYRKIDKLGLSFPKDGADGAGFSPQAPNT